jgi:ferritin-like metal-binding protein YciE
METMQALMLEELRELYSAERLALRAYPRLRKIIETDSLRQAVETHMEQTKEQIERLGQVFEMMQARTRGKTCHSMQGLVEEAEEHLEADLPPELLEVMLLADLQKIEHLEIAAYGSARAHAEALGMQDAARLLQATLDEERQTDTLLNEIALRDVNPRAVAAMQDVEEGEEEEGARAAAGGGGRRSSGRSSGAGRSSASNSGGSSSSGGGGSQDLKSREYRDAQGNVHHHTRTSGAQRGRE